MHCFLKLDRFSGYGFKGSGVLGFGGFEFRVRV